MLKFQHNCSDINFNVNMGQFYVYILIFYIFPFYIDELFFDELSEYILLLLPEIFSKDNSVPMPMMLTFTPAI